MHVKQRNPRSEQQLEHIFQINFHRFMEMYEHYKLLEIAEELGIILKEVHLLKQKVSNG